MLCPSCQSDVLAGQPFCGRCGTRLPVAEDLTVTSGAARTVAARTVSSGGDSAGRTSGWLSTSGSIDHGRFAPGAVLDGRYRIIGLLGRGGMGEVYRADDLRLGQPVALKFLPPALTSDNSRLAQLHNEVRTARQVSHANVCRVHDIGEVALGDSGQSRVLYLSMEYVDGEDLAASLKRVGRFPEDRALELARQICAGLGAAHDRGIIHRDLKPANIMIDADGRARIMDFGLAAAGAVEDIRVGTPAYMAPEQIEGREVTAKSDIFALGLVLYELFTGRRAFNATTIADLVQQQALGVITAPTDIVKGLDPAIERAVLRCLDRDPARRPSSVLAVSAALPGGDPLAAALAAGETPSPEMVAAAGGDRATLTARAGTAWMGLAAVLLLVVTALSDRVSFFSLIPLPKRPEVLADRAEELRQSLGYTDTADQAAGFFYDTDYIGWAMSHGTAEARWADLPSGKPAAMRFWYRTSPRKLIPFSPNSWPGLSDPPFNVTGMTITQLDPKGQLLLFEAMPRQIDPTDSLPARTVDWTPAMAAAGLDASELTEIVPGRTPRTFADARHAWRGTLPGTSTAITVETASYRGRPVYFEVIAPWTPAARDPGGESDEQSQGPLGVVFVLLLLGVSGWLTRRNLQSGRADRRGAFRVGAFMVVLYAGLWMLAPHIPSLAVERGRFFTTLGLSLFLAGAVYILYLALEPFVRKSWPAMLGSWSRLVSGRLRDAFVGRDLLIGIACGLLLTLTDFLAKLVPTLLGWAPPIPHEPLPITLLGLRAFAIAVLGSFSAGLQQGLIGALTLASLRLFMQRVLQKLKLRWSVDAVTVALAIFVVAAVAILDADGGPGANHIWVTALTQLLGLIVALFLIMRAGLLAAVFAFTVNAITDRVPLTFDNSRFYAGESWFVLAALFALAVIGFRWARAGAGVPSRDPA